MEQISISSDAFNDGSSLPVEQTCDGEDCSPALSWERLPDSTRSITLIADDPDGPRQTFVHWVIYNIPADSSGLPRVYQRTIPWTTAACRVTTTLTGLAITDPTRRRVSPTGISSRYMPWILHLS